MPRYKNNKPSILGLRFGAGGGLRTVLPGEVFEADAAQIPQVYLVQRWIVPTTEPVTPTPTAPPGVTDQQAALSGAYGEEARNAAIASSASAPASEPTTSASTPPSTTETTTSTSTTTESTTESP